jgi:pyruvate dehydrogenase E1 component alpha subunit
MKRDPITVLRDRMEQAGELTDADMTELDNELRAVVEDAWNFADNSPEPPLEALYEDVFVDTTSDADVQAAVVG